MKKIAFFPLTPLGDCIAQMEQLREIHRLYSPCHITVFAIPLIAELYRNYQYCDEATVLDGKIHEPVAFREIPQTEFDIVFNHGYDPCWSDMLRQIKYKEAYGMEEIYRSEEECKELFTKYVPLDYWKNVTLKKYQFVAEQMGEVIRLVNPDFTGTMPQLDESCYHCTRPEGVPENKYVLFLPGTSALVKYWPIDKYLQLAKYIESAGLTALFVTGPQDTVLQKDLQASGFLYFDNLSLSELAYTAAHAQLVIGNDSGPMHLAMAFDTPSISFFSFTGADNWFQYDRKRHKVLMLPCGQNGFGCKENNCQKSCIGKIPLKDAVYTSAKMLCLPQPKLKEIAYFVQDLIGDALVNIENLKALSNHYTPCNITVFCTAKNRELFDNYAFCDSVFCFEPGVWRQEDLPQTKFDAVFNNRYDMESLKIIKFLNCDKVYGYESCDITEELCKQYYTAYLPLTLWDNFEFRRKTSVTEQGAELVRLVYPDYHCQRVSLYENTFKADFTIPNLPHRVILVPNASNKEKNWGNENYIALAEKLKNHNFLPLFLIGPKEKDNAVIFREAGFEVKENVSFSVIAAYFFSHKISAVIGNDTGIMHLACMCDVPTVTISCHGTHYTWFPYDRKKHKICYPSCSHILCSQLCKDVNLCNQKNTLSAVWKEFIALCKDKIN